MVRQATFVSASALYHRASLQPPSPAFSILSSGPTNLSSNNLSLKAIFSCRGHPCLTDSIATIKGKFNGFAKLKIYREESGIRFFSSPDLDETSRRLLIPNSNINASKLSVLLFAFGQASWLIFPQSAYAREDVEIGPVYETGELFEVGIQLSYLLLLLGLLGVGTFYVIRQVLVRRELDLSAKELQEQVRSGDAGATELFELGAVMLRRKFYPAANKYLLQAIEKWDGDDQDLAQVYNALGVSYVRDGKIEKGIKQFETAVKLQPGYVTAWNNLGDAYEKKREYKSALNAFEEALLFDPNNKVARPRRDALKDRVQMYKGVPVNTKER